MLMLVTSMLLLMLVLLMLVLLVLLLARDTTWVLAAWRSWVMLVLE